MKQKQLLFFITFCLVCIGSTQLLAQTTYTLLKSPIKYGKPIDGQIDYQVEEGEERSGTIWYVYADRDGIYTSSRPDANDRIYKTKFLEYYYVIGEEGNYLQIAQGSGDVMKDLDNDGNLVNGKDLGWIHKEHLILWRACLATQTKIDSKAMLLNTVEGINPDKIKSTDFEKIKFFLDPTLTAPSKNTARLFDFFYIYKKTANAVLLGKDAAIPDPANIKKNILGWVPTKKIILWDHRVVAERNWEPEAREERHTNNARASVFFTEGSASSYQTGGSVHSHHKIWQEEIIKSRRDPGQRKRFPIISKNDKIMKVGAMGLIYNLDGAIKTALVEDTQAKYNREKDPKRNINVVFVIDATKGMDLYLPSITEVIKQKAEKQKKRKNKNKLRFGTVVYRDTGASKVFDAKKVSTNTDGLIKFLNKTSFDFSDKDIPDALYYGINKAIQNTGINRKETNIIIVVAGSANHEREDKTFLSDDELITSLYNYNCHLFNILTVNATDDHSYFIDQMSDILKGVANKGYQNLVNDAKIDEFIKRNPAYLEKPSLTPIAKNQYVLERTSHLGGISHPVYGMRMSPERLSNELKNIIDDVEGETNKLLDRLDYLVEGYGESGNMDPNVGNFGPYLLSFLLRSGFTKEQIEILREDNVQLYQPGYAPIRIEGHKYDLFKPSLFLNYSELNELIDTFKEFEKASRQATASKSREELQRVWITLLLEYLGGAEGDFMNMSMYEINEKIFGLPGNSEFLNGVKLRDITDESVFSVKDFQKYTLKIGEKLVKLQGIYYDTEYAYSFRSNDQRYFWIAEYLLP